MSADEFGFGPCHAETESRLSCSEAAIGEDHLCRWHTKLARHLTRRAEQESKPAPAPKRKVTK